MSEKAILMAAGLGTRMRPLTEKKPKPLIPVFGRPMIETVIDGLCARGVCEIAVVTGYLGEQFAYLTERYENVRLIPNPDYQVMNNISSLYAARSLLGEADCFICEADLYVADPSIFAKELPHSCYYGRMQAGWSDDWVFDLKEDRIVRVGKGGNDTYNMVGIAFFKKEEGRLLRSFLEEAVTHKENAQIFWDDVVDRNLDKLYLRIEPVTEGQLVEIDTVEELRRIEERGERRPAQD